MPKYRIRVLAELLDDETGRVVESHDRTASPENVIGDDLDDLLAIAVARSALMLCDPEMGPYAGCVIGGMTKYTQGDHDPLLPVFRKLYERYGRCITDGTFFKDCVEVFINGEPIEISS